MEGVPDELTSKIQFYAFLQGEQIDLSPALRIAKKGKKGKGKAKSAKPVVNLDRALVESATHGASVAASEKFYLTTAINYTNGDPHIGHVYEAVTADTIARYHRTYGRDVFFLTGTDEHGQKVEMAAQKKGITPQEVCDYYAKGFRDLDDKMLVSYDNFIRTTAPHHENLARRVWLRVRERGDIYVKPYVGWYNVHEEAYVTEVEAKKTDYKDEYGRPFERKEEESYFFRMGKYQEALVNHIQENPEFIQPDYRRAEMLSFLKEPLQDLCISRTVCQWGVRCPFDPDYKGDKSHVMYVWFDALSNYLSGVGYLKGENDTVEDNSRYWPADVHIVGKDIVRFHTIIWPTMLMAADIPLPKCVMSHGFIVAKDGRKLSKSLGNAPVLSELLAAYPVDAIRFYLAHETTYGADFPFNEETLCSMHNAVLLSGVGNLLHRSTTICGTYCNGKIPETAAYKLNGKLPFDVGVETHLEVNPISWFKCLSQLKDLVEKFEGALCIAGGFQLQNAALAVVAAVTATNKFLQDTEPWKLKGDEYTETRKGIVRTCLEALYILGHFLLPLAPQGSEQIFEKLGVKKSWITCLSPAFDNLPSGTTTYVGDVLYQQIAVPGSKKSEAGNGGEASGKQEKKKNKDATRKGVHVGKGKPQGKAASNDFEKMDIRVGRIVKAWNHEAADGLFCELIDVGEEKPREIASGLRKFYTLEEMTDRNVLVVCNLKPSKLKGFASHGMVLCASSATKVEFVEPAEGSKIGERIFLEGDDPSALAEPASASQVTRKKVFQKVAVDLRVDSSGTAVWQGKKLQSSGGSCQAPTLTNVGVK